MAHPRRQHYVPRFLLSYFQTENGKTIWAYDKKFRNVEERSISTVPTAEFFYDDIAGEQEGSLEYELSKIETASAPIIKKIIETKDLNSLSFQERSQMALFAAVQDARTVTSLEVTTDILMQFRVPIEKWGREVAPNIKLEFGSPKDLWRNKIEECGEFANIFIRKKWFLFESEKSAFIISDHPLVKQNQIRREGRGMLGFDSDGIEMYLPLTPSLVIGFVCERIYSNLPDDNIICNEGNVENINSLQVNYANRFIFSHNNNFDLAMDMLDNP